MACPLLRKSCPSKYRSSSDCNQKSFSLLENLLFVYSSMRILTSGASILASGQTTQSTWTSYYHENRNSTYYFRYSNTNLILTNYLAFTQTYTRALQGASIGNLWRRTIFRMRPQAYRTLTSQFSSGLFNFEMSDCI